MHKARLSLVGLGLLVLACGDEAPPAAPTTAGSTGSTTTAGPTSTAGTPSSTEAGQVDSTGAEGGCGVGSAAQLAACVELGPLADDIGFIADLRTPGSTHWLAVQELCVDRLTMLGYEIQLHDYGTGINVVGRRPGTTTPEEVVLIGAHYDHIPECLGADDNATGVAGALEAARVLAQAELPRTIAIACWDEEELGLIGSSAWVEGGQAAGESVIAYFNYDMIGYLSDEPDSQATPTGFNAVFPEQYQQLEDNDFRGDFVLYVADDLALGPVEAYEAHAEAQGLPTIGAVLDAVAKNSDVFADLRRSDHAPFWGADIPAIFLTDTGEFRNTAYHCMSGEDSVDRLDPDFARRVVATTVGAAAETLGLP